MCGERKKERKDEGGRAGPKCCPENIQEMFLNMSTCCPSRRACSDYKEILSRTREGCCGPEAKGEKD